MNMPFRIMQMDQNLDAEITAVPNGDPGIWKYLRFSRTRARAIAVNCIGKGYKQGLAAELRSTFFSVSSDESTNISRINNMVILVNYPKLESGKKAESVWEILEVFEKNKKAEATGERLYTCITESFMNQEVPLQNIFCVSFDGASANLGVHDSIVSRLQVLIPDIIVMRCFSHSTDLCVGGATKTLPKKQWKHS